MDDSKNIALAYAVSIGKDEAKYICEYEGGKVYVALKSKGGTYGIPPYFIVKDGTVVETICGNNIVRYTELLEQIEPYKNLIK